MVDIADVTAEYEMASHIKTRIGIAIADSGMTLEAIGEAMGVSKTAVHKWRKTGQITMAKLWRFAALTRKPMAWFFPGYAEGPADAKAVQDGVDFRELLFAEIKSDPAVLERVVFEVLRERFESRSEL